MVDDNLEGSNLCLKVLKNPSFVRFSPNHMLLSYLICGITSWLKSKSLEEDSRVSAFEPD